MSSYQKAIIALSASAIFWASAVTIVRASVSRMPLFTFTLFRFLVALLIFIPIIIRDRRKIIQEIPEIFPVTLLAAINLVLFTWGIQYTTADMSQVIYAGVTILTLVFSILIFKEHFPKYKIIGALIGLAGILLIILVPLIETSFAYRSIFTIGNILIFIGSISWTFFIIISKKKLDRFRVEHVNIIFFFTTMLFSLIFSFWEMKTSPIWSWAAAGRNIPGILYVGIFGTAVTYFLYQYALKNSSPFIVSLNNYFQPVCTFVIAGIFLGERLTPLFLTGTVFIFTGLMIATDFKSKIWEFKKKAR